MKDLTIQWANESDEPITINVEPWIVSIELKPGSSAEIGIHFEELGVPLITHDSGGVTLWLWKSCTCRIKVDEVPLAIPFLEVPSP